MSITVFNSNQVDTKKQPMFFGAPLGMQRYDEYKYPDFERLTQSQLGFLETRGGLTTKDRSDYKTLNDQQKHIYTSTLNIRSSLIVCKAGPWHGIRPLLFIARIRRCYRCMEFHGANPY